MSLNRSKPVRAAEEMLKCLSRPVCRLAMLRKEHAAIAGRLSTNTEHTEHERARLHQS
jgi:hypothetical protein